MVQKHLSGDLFTYGYSLPNMGCPARGLRLAIFSCVFVCVYVVYMCATVYVHMCMCLEVRGLCWVSSSVYPWF